MTSRRGLLRAGGLAATALLAGCTQDVGEELPPNRERPVSSLLPDLPVEQRVDAMAARIESTATAEVGSLEELAGLLRERQLDVHAVEVHRDVLVVEYRAAPDPETGHVHDVGTVVGAYTALVASGHRSAALEVTILDDAPSSYGVAEAERGWADDYLAGVLAASEYAEHVAGTVESSRHDPDVEVEPGG